MKEPLARGGVVCEVELSMESCFKENTNQCPEFAFWFGGCHSGHVLGVPSLWS